MSLEVEKSADEIIIKPIGEFDFRLDEAFRKAYQNEKPDMRYILDLKKVTWLDSTALGMMIKLHAHTGGNIDIKIINSSSAVKEVFNIVHFSDMFEIL
ncbi:MAG: STAS domain-containing protein [Magnetococcales bacterium]|nr:STAS domain-containing protein [Magnetococcales bacterium]